MESKSQSVLDNFIPENKNKTPKPNDESDLTNVTDNSFMIGYTCICIVRSSYHVVDLSLCLQSSDVFYIKSSCLIDLYDLHTYHQ